MTIINKTMVPLNKYGVPCTDAMNYPSRSNSSSVGEGSPGTFYLKKQNQGLYLVEAKLQAEDYVLAWNWTFNQTTNICDPGINVTLIFWPAINGRSGYTCPTVSEINALSGFSYNEGGSESFSREIGLDYTYMYFSLISNKPTNVRKLVLDVTAQGEVYFVFSTTEHVYLMVLAGDGTLFNPEDYDGVFYGNEAVFPAATINWCRFGLGDSFYLGGRDSSFSFRDISFYR